MNKKMISLALSGLIILSNISYTGNVYAYENKNTDKSIENQDSKSKKIVYLADGEGNTGDGNGTKEKPYQNIRTALANINDGEVLKLVGNVVYTKYDYHIDKSALPLVIDKNITIEGEAGATFYLRAPIQLGANVIFKDLKLEMVPQVLLGRNIEKSERVILGEEIPRSATIFAAGYELTLDNVNTRLGTNLDQYNDRPYISGGVYKDTGKLGKKSVINIVNPNSETKISGIYAGDYWYDRDLDVEINLDGKLIDTTIYTGGVEHKLNGDVVVNLGPKSNAVKFDKSNHNGNLDVNLKSGFYNVDFDAAGVRNITLEENSKLGLAKNTRFDVNNVALKNNAVIDFREMNSNPIVNGNFEGVENTNTSIKGGAILLDNEQTLDIKGILTGTSRLNNNGSEYINPFIENHVYVKANSKSQGNLSIEDSQYDNFELQKNMQDNNLVWTVIRKEVEFKDFKWIGGVDKIVNNTIGEYLFQIEFIDKNDKTYEPDIFYLLDDFEYIVEKPDGTKVDYDTYDDNVLLNVFTDDEGVTQVAIIVINLQDLQKGEMTLTVTHKASKKSISRTIYVLDENKKLSGNVSISGEAKEGSVLSVDISNIPIDSKDLTYKWYVNGVLDIKQTGSNFTLSKEHAEKSIKVEVEAKNYLGTIYSKEVVVEVNSNDNNHNNNGNHIIINDIKNHWAEENINKFVQDGYINGYSDGTFRANNAITRAEFVKIFNKYFGLTETSGRAFNDTKNHWAKNEIDIAVTNGVVNGVSENEFKPNEPITREQVAKMMSNYLKLNVSNSNQLNNYKDKNEISSWALSSVSGVIEEGYMSGYPDNTFKPKNNMTRAEAVVALSRINKDVVGK